MDKRFGFMRVGAASLELKISDVSYNVSKIKEILII